MAAAAVLYGDVAEALVARKLTLKQARLRKFWSMNRLANEAGLAASTVMAIERKNATPRLSTIEKLAKALGVEATDINWPDDPLGEGDEDDEGSERTWQSSTRQSTG